MSKATAKTAKALSAVPTVAQEAAAALVAVSDPDPASVVADLDGRGLDMALVPKEAARVQ